jgi:hypothetical protein
VPYELNPAGQWHHAWGELVSRHPLNAGTKMALDGHGVNPQLVDHIEHQKDQGHGHPDPVRGRCPVSRPVRRPCAGPCSRAAGAGPCGRWPSSPFSSSSAAHASPDQPD